MVSNSVKKLNPKNSFPIQYGILISMEIWQMKNQENVLFSSNFLVFSANWKFQFHNSMISNESCIQLPANRVAGDRWRSTNNSWSVSWLPDKVSIMGKGASDTCRSTKNWQSSLATCQMLLVGGHQQLERGKGWPLRPYGSWTKVISRSRKPELNSEITSYFMRRKFSSA